MRSLWAIYFAYSCMFSLFFWAWPSLLYLLWDGNLLDDCNHINNPYRFIGSLCFLSLFNWQFAMGIKNEVSVVRSINIVCSSQNCLDVFPQIPKYSISFIHTRVRVLPIHLGGETLPNVLNMKSMITSVLISEAELKLKSHGFKLF